MQPTYVLVITHGGARTRDDGPIPQVRLAAQEKVQFDVDTERDTFFDSRDSMKRYTGKFPIYEIPHVFDSTLVPRPSRKHGTLQSFFEGFLSLAKDLDALAEIASLLYQLKTGRQNSIVNSLHKKKTEKGDEDECPNW